MPNSARRLIEMVGGILNANESLVLATVVEQIGSAPRAGGAWMAVRRDGSIAGTIGGGKVEAEVVRFAKTIFETRKHRLTSFDLTGAAGADLDLICGGRMEILLEYLEPTPEERQLWEQLGVSAISHAPSFLVRRLSPEQIERALVRAGKKIWGSDRFPSELIEKCRKGRTAEVVPIEGDRFFLQPFRTSGRVCLFGAGHVALEVAKLAHYVGFEVVVLDDREEFVNRARFPEAADVIVLRSFEACVAPLQPDDDTCLVILTRGHRHDRVVLEQALRSHARYVGMIGSRSKWGQMSEEMLKDGFSKADIERVHTPIGVPIRSESPEEIAVSIVAELIANR
jgi:xanthine dehydrogenase accessory factor